MAQVSSGLDFEIPVGTNTTVNGGLSGVWSFSEGTGTAAAIVPDFEGGRARVDLGVNHRFTEANTMSLSGYYDGLGTPDFESFGVEINWNVSY